MHRWAKGDGSRRRTRPRLAGDDLADDWKKSFFGVTDLPLPRPQRRNVAVVM
jgi:hypothetical protein